MARPSLEHSLLEHIHLLLEDLIFDLQRPHLVLVLDWGELIRDGPGVILGLIQQITQLLLLA